jgi:hypothetical protein
VAHRVTTNTDAKDSFISADPQAAPSQRDDSVEVPSPTQLSLAAIEFRRDLRMSAEAPIAAGESVRRSAAPAC